MDFEEWWDYAKKNKSTKTKYMARQGWYAALEFGCYNSKSETEKRNKNVKDEIISLENKIRYLKEKIVKVNSAQKLDHPQLFITRDEPPLSEYIEWIRWWREMRKSNGLSFTFQEARDVHEKLKNELTKEIKKLHNKK